MQEQESASGLWMPSVLVSRSSKRLHLRCTHCQQPFLVVEFAWCSFKEPLLSFKRVALQPLELFLCSTLLILFEARVLVETSAQETERCCASVQIARSAIANPLDSCPRENSLERLWEIGTTVYFCKGEGSGETFEGEGF